MSKVTLLQSFANALLGIHNAAMDIFARWEANDPLLGPRRCGSHFEDYVSGPTDLDGLWAWLMETGVEIDAETFKRKVEEEGVDAFRPCEVLKCAWQEDISTGVDCAKELAGRGLAGTIIPPPGKESKQWLMEVIHCADELKKLVVLAGLTPTTLECNSEPGECPSPAAAKHRDCVKQRHIQVEQLPAVADKLMEYRQWILTQVCVEATPDDLTSKSASNATSSAPPISNQPDNASKVGYVESRRHMPEEKTFFLHYWPNCPIYVCLRDCNKRPFDFSRGAFRPTAELEDLAQACLRAAHKPEWRADYGCSYSVSVDLTPMKARADNPTGLKDGDQFEVFWILQTGDKPSPNQDKIVGSGCRMILTDGLFSAADPRSTETVDEKLLFARREARQQEAREFREAEQQWADMSYDRRDRAVKAADIGEVLRVLATDLLHWGDNLKHHLFHHVDERCDDEMCRSLQARLDNAPVPVEIQVPWVIRDLVSSREAYDMLEFHKSREYAQGFAQRFDALHQERLAFSRKIVDYTAQFGRDLVLEPFVVLDELRKDLRAHAQHLAQHLMLVADQFPVTTDSGCPSPTKIPNAREHRTWRSPPSDTPDQFDLMPADDPRPGLIGVPWWHALDLVSQELTWEPEWLSVSDITPDAILHLSKEFRTTVNEMQSAPYMVGRWAAMEVLEDCKKLAILATGYGLDPKPLLQTAWNIEKNRFNAGDWPFPGAFRSCSFLLTEIETRAKAAIVRRISSGICEEEPTRSDGPSATEQCLPYNLIPPNQLQWRNDPPVELTPQQWRLLSHCLGNPRTTVQDVADSLWDDGTASDRTEAAIDSLKSKLNTRLAEANIPVSISRKAGFLLLAIDG